jgi:hypothetical protein
MIGGLEGFRQRRGPGVKDWGGTDIEMVRMSAAQRREMEGKAQNLKSVAIERLWLCDAFFVSAW